MTVAVMREDDLLQGRFIPRTMAYLDNCTDMIRTMEAAKSLMRDRLLFVPSFHTFDSLGWL